MIDLRAVASTACYIWNIPTKIIKNFPRNIQQHAVPLTFDKLSHGEPAPSHLVSGFGWKASIETLINTCKDCSAEELTRPCWDPKQICLQLIFKGKWISASQEEYNNIYNNNNNGKACCTKWKGMCFSVRSVGA